MDQCNDEPRLASAIKRGWHVLRADMTWGLVRAVQSNGNTVLLMFEDRPADEVTTYPVNAYYLTRNPEEQMRAAVLECASRSRQITATHRARQALRRSDERRANLKTAG